MFLLVRHTKRQKFRSTGGICFENFRYNIKVKALSIKQPWAWAIVNCGKDIENRSRRKFFRGEFYIHATKWGNTSEFDDACEFIYEKSGIYVPPRSLLLIGGIIGTSRVVDCVQHYDSVWFEGPWGFVLDNTKEVDFIECKGALGFWNYD